MFGVTGISAYAALIVLGQMSGGATVSLSMWATRLKKFRRIALSGVVQSTSTAVAQILAGLLVLGAAGLLGGWIVGSLAGVVLLAAWVIGPQRTTLAGVSPAGMWQAAKRYRRFVFLTSPSNLLNSIGLRAPLLILTAVYGTSVGGQYALAERVAILPVALAAAAVAQVYYAHAAPLARREDDSLRSLFIATTKSLAKYALIPMALTAIAAPIMFGIIFGSEWVEAGLFAAALTPWFYLTMMMNPTGRTLDVLERQDLHLSREVTRLILLAATATMIVIITPPPLGAVLMLSVAGCVTYMLYGYISWRAINSSRPRPGVRSSAAPVDVEELPPTT
jgi:O-antigen/teichoic acid export membrane protein